MYPLAFLSSYGIADSLHFGCFKAGKVSVMACPVAEPIILIVQAAFKMEHEAALKKAEVAKDLPGAFTNAASPGVRTRSQARKML